ncbi:cupin domain-containing protein [Massilia soli]|uniref:Cupin domain-containing protein n=1 Tax=Massilia soli TaxID=2792854 RepID=A0ABS7SSC3_9BURK|nr:cupin domain-containing protein [Massilia soli]MBZ2208832.1 cupin domain-containing protein [Massilia soli]
MKLIQTLARSAAAALIASAVLLPAAHAQKFDDQGIARTESVRHDYDHKNEAIQVRVDFAHGASFPAHSHPGVEIAYVLSGTLEYAMDGKTIRLTAGESLYIPAGAVHAARNAGDGVGSELATYLVEKGKPIVVLAK